MNYYSAGNVSKKMLVASDEECKAIIASFFRVVYNGQRYAIQVREWLFWTFVTEDFTTDKAWFFKNKDDACAKMNKMIQVWRNDVSKEKARQAKEKAEKEHGWKEVKCDC